MRTFYLVLPTVLAIKKAECWRIDAFELWCWRRLLTVHWTARRSNQSILKEISPECSLEGCWGWNSSTLATWCEELTHLKRPWCWERLKARAEGDDRGLDCWMASLTQWTWVWVNSRSWWWTGRPGVLQSMESQRVGYNWATELTDLFSKDSIKILPHMQTVEIGTWKGQHFINVFDFHAVCMCYFPPKEH